MQREINMATYIALSSTKMKKKRKRTIISKKDLEKLEALFKQDKWPERSQKIHLATVINKSENFINTWFQNRRAKFRRLKQQDSVAKSDDTSVKLTFHDVRFSTDKTSKPYGANTRNGGTQKPIGLEEIKQELNAIAKCPDPPHGTQNRRRSSREENDDHQAGPEDRCRGVSWEFVFQRTVQMAAASEGAMSDGHPSLTKAVRDAALGLGLKDAQLVYSREYGLDFVDTRPTKSAKQ